jgi:hypothetical protein
LATSFSFLEPGYAEVKAGEMPNDLGERTIAVGVLFA